VPPPAAGQIIGAVAGQDVPPPPVEHIPDWQVAPAWQVMPQPPQLALSISVLAQVVVTPSEPTQVACVGPQVVEPGTHVAFTHIMPAPQTMPHWPQLAESVW
jgi:hypothetical protein